MNVKQKNQKDNFADSLLRAKQQVSHEKEEKEKQLKIVRDIFKDAKKQDLLEEKATIMRDQDRHIGPKVDFSYYKLNIKFLKKFGMHLEIAYTDIIASETAANIMYIEYYIDKQNSCVVFVKHYFKHLRLYSDNGATNVLTYTFVNTKSEIYYYDEFIGDCKLLKCLGIRTNLAHAKNLLRGKTFKAEVSGNRLFKLYSNDTEFEEKSMSDIHLVIQNLMDILINQYKDEIIPSKSKVHIETSIVGSSDKPVDVQTKVTVNYKHSGVIQTTGKLLEYELTLYFLDFPENKVKARFYMTEAEKSQSLELTDELLKNIVFEVVGEPLKEKTLYYKVFYRRFIMNKESFTERDDSELKEIANVIYHNSWIKGNFYECPELRNSFKGIYFEHFGINSQNVSTKFAFEQISEYELHYNGKSFVQTAAYSVIYNNQVYLVGAKICYSAHYYADSSVRIYLPAFTSGDISLLIFKPVNPNEVIEFVKSISDNNFPRDPVSFYSSHFHDIVLPKPTHSTWPNNFWKTTFPDFEIQTEAKQENYKIVEVESEEIYSKILDCIKCLRCEDSNFNFSINYPFGFGDDESPRTRVPLINGDLTYGYYFDDGFNKISVNSPFKSDCTYSYSSGDELIKVLFDEGRPYYKTTLYALLESCGKLLSRDSKVEKTTSCKKNSFWNHCINFLLSISSEDLFK